jgi:hypothetical protein
MQDKTQYKEASNLLIISRRSVRQTVRAVKLDELVPCCQQQEKANRTEQNSRVVYGEIVGDGDKSKSRSYMATDKLRTASNI